MQGDQAPQTPGWQFTSDNDGPGQIPEGPDETVSWSASEYMSHQKSASWYMILAIGAVLISIIVFLMTRDFISSGVILIAAGAMGVLGAKQPRVLDYQLSNRGLTIGGKYYDYTSFKSFSVVDEGGPKSINLMPLKRFMPMLSVFFAPEDEDKVVNILSSHLALDHHEVDLVDRFMRKVRF